MLQCARVLGELSKRVSNPEPKIDGLLDGGTTLGDVPQRSECLLVVGHGRRRHGPCVHLLGGAASVSNRRLPRLCAESVIGKPLYVLREPLRKEALHGRNDRAVKHASTILEEAAVGDVVSQRVLERIVKLRKESAFVEELGRLEP